MFIVKFKKLVPGEKCRTSSQIERNQYFPNTKNLHKSHELDFFPWEVIFQRVQVKGSKISKTIRMLTFVTIIVFLISLGLGVTFSRWGKKSQVGVNVLQVYINALKVL